MKKRVLRTRSGPAREAREVTPPRRTREERLAAGRALRERAARTTYGAWKRPSAARDPVELLERTNEGRVPELVPIRYGRMLQSPFAFLRGAAVVMAHDLAAIPSTGEHVQACGDCHLLNFGLFATPERKLVFDVNDFDETLPAPWEWDVARLAASAVLAARERGRSEDSARDVAAACARAYREHLRACSRMTPLEVWYSHLDLQAIIDEAPDAAARRRREKLGARARANSLEALFPKITTQVGGRARFVDDPPLFERVREPEAEDRIREGLEAYRASLPDERRRLLDRYRVEDFARKVVGIGSVGTRCWVALFATADGEPLVLQIKEASRSVLERYAGKGAYAHQGQRVVVGQRLMQSASDIFLGWTRTRSGHDSYVRQLRDMKLSVPIERASAAELARYAALCGRCLARAHARSGDAAILSGYLGKGERFDAAIAAFALAYADQTERDHAALEKAVRRGRVAAEM